MYSVWKNAKCIAIFKTYKGALRRFTKICITSDVEKDCVELYRDDYVIDFR